MNEQRRRALRRRRRRRQHIKRRILCVAIAAAAIAAIAAFASFAASRNRIEAAEEMKEAEKRQAVDIVGFTTEKAAETAKAEPATEATTEPTLIKSLDWGAEDAYILAKMAMAEAEGEDTEGKALVILVILNRVWSEQFPDTILGVVSQKNAFTSYSNGRYDRVEPDEDCMAALRLVESHWDESQGALYFERTPAEGESTWHSRNLEKLFIHGNHTFYKEKEVSGE